MTPQEQDAQTAAVLEEWIDKFRDETGDDYESEDLAWALVRALRQAGIHPPA